MSIWPQLVQPGWRADEDQLLVVDLSAQFADSDEWALAGYSSAGRWIADQLDVTRRTANDAWGDRGVERAAHTIAFTLNQRDADVTDSMLRYQCGYELLMGQTLEIHNQITC